MTSFRMAFMRCVGCGMELEKSQQKSTVSGTEPGEVVITGPDPFPGEETAWWAEAPATHEFEEVPRLFAAGPPELVVAEDQNKPVLPTLGPRLVPPPRLPLPLVEEEKAHHHWPLNANGEKASARQSVASSRPEDWKVAELSPSPWKEAPGSSTASTRSSSSRARSSNSFSTRSSGSDDTLGGWRSGSRRSRLESDERRPIVCPAIKWRISLDRAEGKETLGLNLTDLPATKDREGALRIRSVEPSGLAKEWNDGHGSKEVKKGDYIVEINGVHGGPEELREALTRDVFLDIMMMRGT